MSQTGKTDDYLLSAIHQVVITLILETTSEPVQVSNKYDHTQIKNAVDDELSRVI